MSVVFTDSFTNSSGSDARIDQWPSAGSPDYAYTTGSTTNVIVSNANDRVEAPTTDTALYIRCIDGTVPTGNQEITATCSYGSDIYDECVLLARMAAGSQDFYMAAIEADVANEVKLARVDAGAATLLASQDQGITSGTQTSGTHVLKATGTTTVALTFTCRGGTPITYSDSSASRKTSGVPGFGMYNISGGSTPYLDALSIDDTTVASSYAPPNILSNMRPIHLGGF